MFFLILVRIVFQAYPRKLLLYSFVAHRCLGCLLEYGLASDGVRGGGRSVDLSDGRETTSVHGNRLGHEGVMVSPILAWLPTLRHILCAMPCRWPSLPCATTSSSSCLMPLLARFSVPAEQPTAGSRTGLYSSVEGYAVVMVGIGLVSCCLSSCLALRVVFVFCSPRTSSQFSIFPAGAQFTPPSAREPPVLGPGNGPHAKRFYFRRVRRSGFRRKGWIGGAEGWIHVV